VGFSLISFACENPCSEKNVQVLRSALLRLSGVKCELSATKKQKGIFSISRNVVASPPFVFVGNREEADELENASPM